MQQYTEHSSGLFVSRYGTVLNHERRVKKPSVSFDGYLIFRFRERGYRVHRVVAEAFIPNPSNLPEVNHIDGNKFNNHVDNLEWCTHQDNCRHAQAEKLLHTKLTEEQVLSIRAKYAQGRTSITALSQEFGVSRSAVHHVLIRKTWRHV